MQTREQLISDISTDAQAADELRERSRMLLTHAVRRGAAAGLTQREIATAIGRSQPEVSRLLHFRGTTPRSRAVMRNRRSVCDLVTDFGGREVFVFGSVAKGTDTEDSDIDLLVDFTTAPSLLGLARLERELATLLGFPVEVTPKESLPARIAARISEDLAPL